MSIELKGICKSYGGQRVLDSVSFALPDRGIVCLMGASGSGKTTLLRILMGLETPDAGSVLNVPDRISVLFQEDRLIDTLTVRSNLRFALGSLYSEKKAGDCLSLLGLPHVLSRSVSALSGGMARRAALARALLYDAPLLVLDEPFKGLDEDSKKFAMDAVMADSALRPVLMVSHDADEAEYMNAKIVRLGSA